MKWVTSKGWIACDLIVFIADLRGTGPTVELAWQVARTVSARLQYLGVQAAARKRRPPTTTPGAWAGSVFRTTSKSVICTVTQDKWDKAKGMVEKVWLFIEQAKKEQSWIHLNYKELEVVRGFLVNLAMTFEVLTHHLKGFHLILAVHFHKRDTESWRCKDKEWVAHLNHLVQEGVLTPQDLEVIMEKSATEKVEAPETVELIPQFEDDLYALKSFFDLPSPPEIECRRQNVCLLLYGFADASGGGLGCTMLVPGMGIRYWAGVWGKDDELT
jgi:hypothetical protein